jgi:hypothetical protein
MFRCKPRKLRAYEDSGCLARAGSNAGAGTPHKPAGAPFAQIALLVHGGDGGPFGLRGYRFTPKAVLFNAWMSRGASAGSFLSLLFSDAGLGSFRLAYLEYRLAQFAGSTSRANA